MSNCGLTKSLAAQDLTGLPASAAEPLRDRRLHSRWHRRRPPSSSPSGRRPTAAPPPTLQQLLQRACACRMATRASLGRQREVLQGEALEFAGGDDRAAGDERGRLTCVFPPSLAIRNGWQGASWGAAYVTSWTRDLMQWQ